MSVCTRFAPSPTGRLHLGNVRTALLNFLFAQSQGGQWILRLDDTDPNRSEEKYKTAIQQDLTWLGLSWDKMFSQSERFSFYETAAHTLKQAGLLYPCYESEQELALARRTALQAGSPPVYNRAALGLSESQRQALEAEGITPHWRFKLSHQTCRFTDLLRGEVAIPTESLSDPVLIRADGRFLYTLPSVVDDLTFNISHVIRGEDHLTNSAVQIELAQALGGTSPIFAHHPLMVDETGTPLSKRSGAFSLHELQAQGFLAPAIAALLIGEKTFSPDQFDLHRHAAENICFDVERLKKINRFYIRALDWQDAQKFLPPAADQKFWEAVRDNLTFLSEAEAWWKIIADTPPLIVQAQERDFLKTALALLPKPDPAWDETLWQNWTTALAAETARKGATLYLPLRVALTGQEKGPEMKKLILLIGYEQVASRLRAAFTSS